MVASPHGNQDLHEFAGHIAGECVVPRVPALHIVAEALTVRGTDPEPWT